MKNLFFIIFLAIAYLSPNYAQAQKSKGDDILDIWWNEERDARFEIYKSNGKYFAKINWLKNPLEEDGTPKVDDENPDESLQSRPLIGLVFMNDFIWDEDDDEWDDGEVYDPDSGNTYDCYMELITDDKLKVRGYIGISILGRTSYWYRYKK